VFRGISNTRAAAQTVGNLLRRHGLAAGKRNDQGIGADEQPLRAELFSVSQLEQHAKSLAAWHELESGPSGADQLLPRLASNEVVLREAYELVSAAVKRGRRITPAAEWFLDNFHLIEEQIRTARRHLPRGYSRDLPRLANRASAGYPRVYDIALELISHADGRVDADSLRAFIASYQSVKPFRLGELWAIPIMLRLALLENLRRVAARVMAGRRERERAGYWVEQMLEIAAKDPARVVLVLAELVKENPPLTNAFVAEFASCLQGQGPGLIFAMTWLEQRLAEQGQTVEQVFQQSSQSQAADQVSIGNSIGSLRFLGATEWRDFVETMSVVEQSLRADPSGVYAEMDFATRDHYRHVVEDIAKLSPLSEDEVARAAVDLAREAMTDVRKTHVGYFLIDQGRPALERVTRMRPKLSIRARRLVRRFPLALYVSMILVTSLTATALVVRWTTHHGIGAWGLAALAVLLIICTSQLAVALVHWAATLLAKPRILPRMNFSEGIPSEHRTVVAVPTLLTDGAEIDDLLEALEVRFLANRDENLFFALLSDFRDAPQETMPEDEALMQRARDGIKRLNAKYANHSKGQSEPEDTPASAHPAGNGDDTVSIASDVTDHGHFFLFHRPRRFNAQEGVWMGWERKRGKLEQFNAALRSDTKDFATIVGPMKRLQRIQYVITLDSDTQLPRDSAEQLVGTMAHPLNRPHFDQKLGRVTDGYSILQPRVGISMPSAGRSRFARLFAGEPGIDPYTRAVSDVYQDVFEEGSFIGKGIYDIDALQQAIGGRFPENRILSHDLLEGAYARSGLVSDVVLFEDFPAAYTADVSRRYRWIRGDWQIIPWLLPRVPGVNGHRERNTISGLSRWKIFDNIRRSLVPVALLILLLAGWFIAGGALFYTVVVIGILLLPSLFTAATELARRPAELPRELHLRIVARTFSREVLREGFALASLPYDAFISFDAIVRTASRLLVTGRKLLEWRTASDAQRSARTTLAGLYTSMWILPALALVVALSLAAFRPQSLDIALPVLGLWLLAPSVAWWMSRPTRPERPRLSEEDVVFLRTVARRTWRFFETFIGPTDNYLPPDNFQEDPPQGAAHRTSPTNIGLALLSNLAAYDFGYVSVGDLIERTSRTLGSVEKLQCYRGHLYNWYDTRTLDPLRPLYVSTVDSGNLAGHLLTLAAGLKLLDQQPLFRRTVFSGLHETLDVVAEIATGEARGIDGAHIPQASRVVRDKIDRLREYLLRAGPHGLSSSSLLLRRLASAASDLTNSVQSVADEELKWWTNAFEQQCRHAITELTYLAPWIELPPPTELMWGQGSAAQISRRAKLRELLSQLDDVPTLAEAARLELSLLPAIDAILSPDSASPAPPKDPDGDEWLSRMRAAIVQGSERAAQRLSEIRQLTARCLELADIDYDFLYDKDRRLLSIGFNVGEHRLDASFYDLLASEARLASFIAIAQGKLPQDHWFSLGRLLTTSTGRPALLSWSGSMFEYLMPLLVMPTYERTLLDETYRAIVERQIEYGRERGIPWGVSESGYSKTDAQLNYQYHPFGVPGLGFKRGLADDIVIAPYASALALMVAPESSCANLRRLAREGLLGPYGFYEAVDYTPARMPRGQESVTVQSYMVHHQGMAFLSLAYLLLDRPMQRRFASEPAFQATDLLLQERIPRSAAVFPHPAEVSAARGTPAESGTNYRVFTTPNTPAPDVHLLSNGRYHVMVTVAGGGYSRWRDLAVTRWHEDPTRDHWGTFCYLRDVDSGEFWSTAHQPTLKRATTYEAIYSQGKAEFRRRDGDIETHVEISVSPEDDIELRRVSVTNHGRAPRTIEITSFAEVVLAPPAADAAHPAFSKLFVQTQLIRERQAILCTRRPRSGPERPPWMMHLMTVYGANSGATSYETNRAKFIGRGRTATDPAAMSRRKLGDSEGSVLDPVVAVRNTVIIGPGETARAHLVTGVSETREGAMGLIEKYHDRHLADRVFELAWTHSQVVHGQLDATEADTQLYGRLASSILYANPLLRASGSVISRNRRGQSGLWGYGISGDLPIVLLRISDQAQIQLVRQLVQAHTYWRVKGLSVDLVIWNEDQSGYRQMLQEQIMGVIASRGDANLLDKPGGIFVRRSEQMSEEDKVLMQTVARVIISDTAGTLAEQIDRRPRAEPSVPRFSAVRRIQPPVEIEVKRPDLLSFNGIGGFTQDGREYVITTTTKTRTPAPWVNVIANPWFGTVVSESGGAYTWCENAHGYRLTPWNNDPISDPSGEAFYIRDEDTGRFWSPTPLPARGPNPYATRHGFGYSIFEYTDDGISTELRTYVATDAPVKFVVIKIRNNSRRSRRLSATGIYELVLGSHRTQNLLHVVTEVDPKSGALLARNSYNSEFGDRVAFLDTSEAQRTVTGDRTEFFGRSGTPANPAGMSRARLSGRVGAGLDPCAAMQVMIELDEGQEREIAFTFGSGRDLADARNLVNRFRGTGPARAALEGVWSYWNRSLGAVHVQTPDASLNFLANGWLLYQVLSCRMWARSGFYQSGGAFGFRDQLQDSMALAHTEPGILREQLLKSAAHQFREGDVQHWWHPPQGRGVRTRISDDYLWLPYATCRYVDALGDTGILDETVRFLDGRLVKPEEESYYDLPGRSEESATLYEHCVRAIKNGLRFGEHGLPLMGCGDWNDGMNLVGEHGKGESVWLAFFLYDVLKQFGALARRRNDLVFAELCATEAAKLQQNIEQNAWDGDWYRRAYFDNGEPLGSITNPECRIDSLPQSWSILSGAGDPSRSRRALESLDAKLVNRKLGVIQLFDPPFDTSSLNPGYIKGYVPGVRENGGQYTHAAVWAVMAFAAAGDSKRAWELFHLINPVRHGDSEAAINQYKVEPYVLAADVYTNPEHLGRGGWTWYTGSAGWMYRLITESLLGLRLEVNRLRVEPVFPKDWESFDIHYRYRETFHHIHVRNTGPGQTVTRVIADGVEQPDKTIPLHDDRQEHRAEVEVGAAEPAVATLSPAPSN
jgi:cellobiose phosphorylase